MSKETPTPERVTLQTLRGGGVLEQIDEALHEADGGAWQVDATARIADFLAAAWLARTDSKPPFGILS